MTEDELRESFRQRRAQRPSLQTTDPPPVRMEVLDADPASSVASEAMLPHGVDGPQASRAIAMRMLGFSTREISDELHVAFRQVQRWFSQARARGRMSDVRDQLAYHVAAVAADQLELLVLNGDKDAIFEALKGTGYLKSGAAAAGDGRGDGAINLQVNVELPVGVRSVSDIPITGQIAGAPREITDGKKTDEREG